MRKRKPGIAGQRFWIQRCNDGKFERSMRQNSKSSDFQISFSDIEAN
jgi:hypothetical protein